MRSIKTLCIVSLLAHFFPQSIAATPFDPQDTPVVLSDNSTFPPDTLQRDIPGKKTTVRQTASTLASRLTGGARSITYPTFKQRTPSLYIAKDTSYVPVCLEVQSANETCDQSVFGATGCISSSLVNLRKINPGGSSASVTDWTVDANDGLTLSWSDDGSHKIEVLTTSNSVSTVSAGGGNIKEIDDAYNPLNQAIVSLNGAQQKFTAKSTGMQFIVHYCREILGVAKCSLSGGGNACGQ